MAGLGSSEQLGGDTSVSAPLFTDCLTHIYWLVLPSGKENRNSQELGFFSFFLLLFLSVDKLISRPTWNMMKKHWMKKLRKYAHVS